MTIDTAAIDWQYDHQGNKIPISRQFDDVYFSRSSGLKESDYVFLQHNHLPERFTKALQEGATFIIGETGFGTGLNFLVTCALWQKIAQKYPNHQATLQFVSTERYPLTADDLEKALGAWRGHHSLPEDLIDALIGQYPLPLAGCHRRRFGTVVLDLWLGDAAQTLSNLAHSTLHKVDAWFLDGFSPNKNSQMWSEALFSAIKQLSKAGTTLTTFTCAGTIKRHLSTIGATQKKVKGFGHKREMLTARFDSRPPSNKNKPTTALVIGGGIAGLSSAYALAQRGVLVTLIDKETVLAGSSGNPCALLSPKLYRYEGVEHQLSLTSFLYSRAFYQALTTKKQAVFYETGVIDSLQPTKKSASELSLLIDPYPNELVHPLQAHPPYNAPPLKDGRFWAVLAGGGQVIPSRFACVVLAHPKVNFVKATINTIAQSERYAYASTEDCCFFADCLVLCAGADTHAIDTKTLGSKPYKTRHIRGQVSFCQIDSTAPSWSVKGEGYACLFGEPDQKTLLFGASFIRNRSDRAICLSEHQDNLNKLTNLIDTNTLTLSPTTPLLGRASVRSQTPDYHPIVGAMTDKVWIHTALGSKGFGFAPFCAELVASGLTGELPCAGTVLLDKLSPKRARLQKPISN